jgi:REase_DpnII-MboI
MARARAAEHQRPRSKTALIEEATLGITKLQEVLAAINDLSQEGFPYRDAAQSKAELQFRECLRHAFGERSQEFQTYRNFKLRTADKAEVARSLAVVKVLIQTLEDRKLELQGLKPPPKPEPPPEASLSNTARMVLVSSATPTTLTGQTHSPMTVAVAMTTNVGPSIAPLIPTPQSQSPIPEPPIITPASTLTPMPVAPQPPPPSVATSNTSSPPAPTAPPTPSAIERPVEVTPAPSPPVTAPIALSILTQPPIHPPTPMSNNPSMPPEMSTSRVQALQDPLAGKQTIGLSIARVIESTLDQDPLTLIRKVCLRFHSVARQLRLRKDYRPTLEVDDDHDLQDLLCALLKVEFDEVATEEWTPPYTGGAARTVILVNRDQIAIVAKKTGPGVTTKELADQVAADSAYYQAQGRCTTIFCFMYDPEGRIGSPKRLETTLTSVSEHCRVEVLVAPK